MRAAVNKWVDGAVLRPDAADKPIWMNDPHWALVAHLKQFVFSFHETILKRVMHEVNHGNYKPAMALASYVPIMIASDLVKGMIQGGGSQPDWKEKWGAEDYLWSGVQRGGLLGTGQFAADARLRRAARAPAVRRVRARLDQRTRSEIRGLKGRKRSFRNSILPGATLYRKYSLYPSLLFYFNE
jgi:hypothetical protein